MWGAHPVADGGQGALGTQSRHAASTDRSTFDLGDSKLRGAFLDPQGGDHLVPRDIGRTVRYLAVKATQKIAVSLEGIPELTLRCPKDAAMPMERKIGTNSPNAAEVVAT